MCGATLQGFIESGVTGTAQLLANLVKKKNPIKFKGFFSSGKAGI
jgi:hypothetical protein